MTGKAITGLMLLVGLINFLPAMGVLSAVRVADAYAVAIDSPDLEILLRHRALLFGIVGGFILYAAFIPSLQPVAMVMAGVSMLGFVYLAWSVDGHNANLQKVLLVDCVGIACLVFAALLRIFADNG